MSPAWSFRLLQKLLQIDPTDFPSTVCRGCFLESQQFAVLVRLNIFLQSGICWLFEQKKKPHVFVALPNYTATFHHSGAL